MLILNVPRYLRAFCSIECREEQMIIEGVVLTKWAIERAIDLTFNLFFYLFYFLGEDKLCLKLGRFSTTSF